MSVLIDANVFVAWERGKFDLVAWLGSRDPAEFFAFPATVWQELQFGKFAWEQSRAIKRRRFLATVEHLAVVPFDRRHAERAAQLAAALKLETIGFANLQIAATAIEERSELLTFNTAHFGRVPGLRLARI